MKEKIKIVLADDHQLLTSGMKIEISQWEEFEVIGVASNGAETVEMCKKYLPDIVLMDMQMPVMSGAEATAEIKKENGNIRIIALTTFDDGETVKNALKAGCDGFLLKIISPEQLRSSLHAVMSGVSVFDDEALKKIRNEQMRADVEFSQRELTILRYICGGFSNKEIAEKLSLQPGTVKNLVSIMLNKSCCVSRSALVRYALENKIVRPE